jgi:hypothetical protein
MALRHNKAKGHNTATGAALDAGADERSANEEDCSATDNRRKHFLKDFGRAERQRHFK